MNENQNEYVDINAHDNYPDSEQTIEIPTMKVIPLKKICMTIGELPTSYLETMTYYEMLIWFIEYLKNNIIPTINNNASAVQEVQSVVLELQNYINDYKDSIDTDVEELEEYMNNYFENLDVQEEINNKLDEYLEDGTLEHIIASYLQTQKIYNTHTEMVADVSNLADGLRVQTLGYYNVNDGGGAFYVISSTADVTKYQEQIGSFYAEMIIENDTINIRQLGAKSDDDTFDNKSIFELYQTICNTADKSYKLIIPNGVWYMSPTWLSRVGGFNIQGVGNNKKRYFSAPVLHAINNQDYILKFGGASDMGSTQLGYNDTNSNNILNNLQFSTGEYSVNYGCLVLEYANYGFYDKLFFADITGTGLYIRSCWENYFGMMSFRAIRNFAKPTLLFAMARSISSVSPNISSSSFDKMIFEAISGDLIKTEIGSGFVNNQIGEINVEYGMTVGGGEPQDITAETDLSGMTPLYLWNGNMAGCVIDTINWTGMGSYQQYITENNISYYFKSLFNVTSGGSTEGYKFDAIINKINVRRTVTQIMTAISPYRAGFNPLFGNILISSAGSSAISFGLFDFYEAGPLFSYTKIQQRENFYESNINAIKLYKESNAHLFTDLSSSGDKLVIGLNSGSTITLGIRYGYDYSATQKTKWLLRVKTNSDGEYAFQLRGKHDGSNVNQSYTATGLTPNTWYTIEIEMNYDYDSTIQFINPNAGNRFDTLTFNGFEAIV